MDLSVLMNLALHDQHIQGLIITAIANLVASEINKRSKKPLGEEIQVWIQPVYMLLSALVAGLDGLQKGGLNVDPTNVSNFLNIWLTTILAHLVNDHVQTARLALKAKRLRLSKSIGGDK